MNKLIYIILIFIICSCSKDSLDGSIKAQGSSEVEKQSIQANLPQWLALVQGAEYADCSILAPGSLEAQKEQKKMISDLTPLEVKLKKSGITFRLIPSGTFTMGSKKGEYLEKYVHKATLTKNFYCGKFELTQGQWIKVMGELPTKLNSPSMQRGSDLPVTEVSWDDCQTFLRKLEKYEGMPENSLSLPTEAQWEYSCRAGTTTEYYFGDTITSEVVNYNGEKPFEGSPKSKERGVLVDVGSLPANAFGLHEMHGNVAEWCADFCLVKRAAAQTYVDGIKDPISKIGENRVVRNGGYAGRGKFVRSSERMGLKPNDLSSDIGFRIVLTVKALEK